MTIINIKDVVLYFRDLTHPAIKIPSYQIRKNDFVILLGSNGSGKSTFLKLLSQQYRATQGQIDFLGKSIRQYTNKEFSHLVSILTQNSTDSLFPSLSLYENYLLVKEQLNLFFHEKKEKEKLAQYLMDFNVNLNKKLDVLVESLSGGERQAFALALALLQPPVLLLLDEHTSALDPKTSAQIIKLTKKMIDQYHITCVLTTHDLDIALQYGNRIIVLHEGEIHKIIDSEEKNHLTKAELSNYYF